MKKLLYILITLILIVIIGYFVVLNLPKASLKGKDAAFSISAVELFNEFDKNENRSNKKYIGKTINVTGSISEIDKDKNNANVIFLDLNDSMSGVRGTLEKSNDISNFKIGQTITLKGLCTGLSQDVVLNKCIVVE